VRQVLTFQGNIFTGYEWNYSAWGKQLGSSSTGTDFHYRYTGEQWDQDLGMYYLRARYYSPEYERFWSMDTDEGSQADPGSLHKYAYCGADPVNTFDPSGHTIVPFPGGGGIPKGLPPWVNRLAGRVGGRCRVSGLPRIFRASSNWT
jgi:RHS repeat-associated protein